MLARVDLDTDVYTLALERMAHVFDTFDHVAVSFSGGKDSTATLHVALEVAHSDPRYERHLPLRAFFHDEEAIPLETEEYVRRVSQRDDVALEWMCLPVKHRNACSRRHPWWWPWAPEDEAKWCRPLPPEARTTLGGFPTWPAEARLSIPDANGLFFPPRLGNCAVLMGIRAQESLTRLRAVRRVAQYGEHNWLVRFNGGSSQSNVWKAYPIYDWRTEDVWTGPAKFGWDWNRAYDRLEMAGVSHAAQRCSPAFGEEPIRGLYQYAACFPEVWARMAERVPGVGAAVRYARTELYGYGSRPEKPPGVTWPEFLSHYLTKHDRAAAAQFTGRIKFFINLHYKKTPDPIAAKAPHPVTGTSWDFLLALAMRGDFKERRVASATVMTDQDAGANPEGKAREWKRYADEIAEHLAAGTFADLAHPGRPPADPYALIPAEYAALLEQAQ